MSSSYVSLGNRPLDQWKVTELREELKKRKLPTRGLKDDLLKRLDEAVRLELQDSTNVSDDDAQSDGPSHETQDESCAPQEGNRSTDIELETGKSSAVVTDNLDNNHKDSFTVDHSEAVETPVVNSEAVERKISLNEPHKDSDGLKDGDTAEMPNAEALPPSDEDSKVDLSDHVKQPPEMDMNSIPENASAESNLPLSETKTEEDMNPKSQKDFDDSKSETQNEEEMNPESQKDIDDSKSETHNEEEMNPESQKDIDDSKSETQNEVDMNPESQMDIDVSKSDTQNEEDLNPEFQKDIDDSKSDTQNEEVMNPESQKDIDVSKSDTQNEEDMNPESQKDIDVSKSDTQNEEDMNPESQKDIDVSESDTQNNEEDMNPESHKDVDVSKSDPQNNEEDMNPESLKDIDVSKSETQNEEDVNPESQKDIDDSKSSLSDSSLQPLKYPVSEVDPISGLQITDSVSAEPITFIKKDELNTDVITDSIKLEIDVKDEMVQTSPNSAVPDTEKLISVDVIEPLGGKDITEALESEDVKEQVQKNEVSHSLDQDDAKELLSAEPSMQMTDGSNMDNISSVKSIDMGYLSAEKLNLDRSPGDDSMEEDVSEFKQMDFEAESNSGIRNSVKSLLPTPMEDDHVDVVHSDPIESKPIDTEKKSSSESNSLKRKLHEEEISPNNELVKNQPQSGNVLPVMANKGLPEISVKRVFSGPESTVGEEQMKERVVPTSLKPPTSSLRIDRFLRPFTLKAVQELLGRTGTVTSFWMDNIKTHCYVSFSTVEEAEKTRNAVYNLQWPPNGGRLLVAEYVDPQEVKARADAPLASPAGSAIPTFAVQPQPSVPPLHMPVHRQIPPVSSAPLLQPPNPVAGGERLFPIKEPLPREQPLPARDRFILPPPPPPPPLPEKVMTLDDFFRKTKSTPRIYYLPLSDEQVAAKLQTPGKNLNQ